MGFNCVSFYTDWALLEGKPGHYSAEGIFALEPFFDAAKDAGIYLLAPPGPYVNAEVSGGGFPGWLQRVNGKLRSSDKAYLKSTGKYVILLPTGLISYSLNVLKAYLHVASYIAHVAATVAKAQITNGGHIILYQPENEYTNGCWRLHAVCRGPSP